MIQGGMKIMKIGLSMYQSKKGMIQRGMKIMNHKGMKIGLSVFQSKKGMIQRGMKLMKQ